jgi:hypothetical protein
VDHSLFDKDEENSDSGNEKDNKERDNHLVWATKLALAAICLVFPVLEFWDTVSMNHVPVPT